MHTCDSCEHYCFKRKATTIPESNTVYTPGSIISISFVSLEPYCESTHRYICSTLACSLWEPRENL